MKQKREEIREVTKEELIEMLKNIKDGQVIRVIFGEDENDEEE